MKECEMEAKGINPNETFEGSNTLILALIKSIMDVKNGSNIVTSYKLELKFQDHSDLDKTTIIRPIDPDRRNF